MTGSRRNELHYGLYIPNFGKSSDPRMLADLAYDAEKSGWDGFFLWDHIVERDRRVPITDSFTALAAIAVKTRHIRIGTAVTPLPRLRPWTVARQTSSLDHLSDGRLILGVGLGGERSAGYGMFGELVDDKVLAEKLDEELDIITGLWTGKPFSYRGRHYRIEKTVFLPTPKQRPRIPIWVGGFWPREGPFKRAAKWDGVIPLILPVRLPQPEDLRNILAYIRKHRTSATPFDLVKIGWTSGLNRKRDSEKITPFVKAGMTWWLEGMYTESDSPGRMRRRIRMGPPRISQ